MALTSKLSRSTASAAAVWLCLRMFCWLSTAYSEFNHHIRWDFTMWMTFYAVQLPFPYILLVTISNYFVNIKYDLIKIEFDCVMQCLPAAVPIEILHEFIINMFSPWPIPWHSKNPVVICYSDGIEASTQKQRFQTCHATPNVWFIWCWMLAYTRCLFSVLWMIFDINGHWKVLQTTHKIQTIKFNYKKSRKSRRYHSGGPLWVFAFVFLKFSREFKPLLYS